MRFLFLLPLVACGSVTNSDFYDDAAFLDALPSASRQGLAAPEEAGGAAEAAAAAAHGLIGPERPRALPMTTSRARHAQSTYTRTPFVLGADTSLPDEEPTGYDGVVLPGGGLGTETPVGSGGQGRGLPGTFAVDERMSKFAPMVQTDEMFGALTTIFDEVFEATEIVRMATPASGDADERRWTDISWHGRNMDVGMRRVGDDEFEWTFAGDDGLAFLTGEHVSSPDAAHGYGAFALDRDAWSVATGILASGDLEVTYDNREGIALGLALVGIEYTDSQTACATGQARQAVDGAGGYTPGQVQVGRVQRYVLVDGEGDYQFLTRRDYGCGIPAAFAVRTRWTEAGVRSDARFRAADTAGTWTQCWSLDGALLYDALELASGPMESRLLREDGNPDACVYPSFAEVDPSVRTESE